MKNIFTKKIFNILFLIITILLPLQTRYFLIIDKIHNNFFEYGTISIHVLDLIIVLFIFYGIIYSIKNKVILDKKSKIFLLLLTIFNLSIIFSTIFSIDKSVAIYNSARILMLSVFSFIIFINRVDIRWFVNCFIISSSIQGFLSIYQFIIQSVSANKYLGISEQLPFNLGTYVIEGGFGRILKSYGSFPHPNMLGLFLLIGLFFILLKIVDHKKEKDLLETSKVDFKMIYLIYVFGINLIGLIFTFSRISIAIFSVLFLTFVLYEFFVNIKHKEILRGKMNYNFSIFIVLIFISLSVLIPSVDLLASRADGNNRLVAKSTNERIEQFKDFTGYIQTKYLTGVGVQNYTIYKHSQNKDLNVWDLKPIHNIYLLILLEIGVFGLSLFLLILIFKFLFNKELRIIIPFIFILLFGLVDHFIWTENFGLILLFMFLGLNNTKINNYKIIDNGMDLIKDY